MSWELNDDEREQFERYLFQIENSRLPVRRLALELYFAHRLLLAAKSCRRLPPLLKRIVDKFPRISDAHAWDLMSAEEKKAAKAGELDLDLPDHEYMRKGFE